MEQFSDFVINHWILVTMFVTVALALAINILKSFEGVTPLQAVNLINQEHALVLDVRAEEDYLKGHIIGSVSRPIDKGSRPLSEIKDDKDKPILVCCKNGGVSIGVVKTLKETGFLKAQSIKGGILAWQQESLPLERKDK